MGASWCSDLYIIFYCKRKIWQPSAVSQSQLWLKSWQSKAQLTKNSKFCVVQKLYQIQFVFFLFENKFVKLNWLAEHEHFRKSTSSNQTELSHTKPNSSTPNQTHPYQTELNCTKPNSSIPNQTKPDNSQPNLTNPNWLSMHSRTISSFCLLVAVLSF